MAIKDFSYDGDLTKPLNVVRFNIGDTLKERPLLRNREIEGILAKNSDNELLASADCADHLATRFAAFPDFSIGRVSKKFGSVSEMFSKRAEHLRLEASKRAGVSFPATIISEKKGLVDDADLTRPEFRVGLTDNPFAIQLNDVLDVVSFRGFF